VASARIQLSLPGFEGTLDLLLRLTEREQVDITAVSLIEVTAQFLRLFYAQAGGNSVALADFVAIAARLLLLKSRRLLPRAGGPVEAAEEDSDGDLLQAMAEYRLFRELAAQFDERPETVGRLFPRAAPAAPPSEPALQPVPVGQLLVALQQALARLPEPEPTVELPQQIVSVEEMLREVRSALGSGGIVGFIALAGRCKTRLEVVVCFIAVLHLIRDGEIEAVQPEPFGEITLRAPN
jgi:segregation and condensation protein A